MGLRQLYTRQQSFEKGIVENWKQDTFRFPTGVLYLENYNPNFEHKSLIKRFGERVSIYKDKPIFFYVKDYSKNVFKPASVNREISFAHDILMTSNPDANKTFLSFIKRLPKQGGDISERDDLSDDTLIALEPECTAVVARVIENNGTDDVLIWTEPFKDEAVFPGWYTVGFYTDHVRYGEQLLFTTALENKEYGTDLDRYLFPVYQWGLWDITKKRKDDNQWWNGYNFTDLETNKRDHRKWKVKTPTMDLLRGDNVGHAWWDKSVGEWDRNGDEKPIEILFMENDLEVATVNTSEDGTWSEDKGVPGEINIGVTDRKSYLAKSETDALPKLDDSVHYGDDTSNIFYESYHVADWEGYKESINAKNFVVTNMTFSNYDWYTLLDDGTNKIQIPQATTTLFNNLNVAVLFDTPYINDNEFIDTGSLGTAHVRIKPHRAALRNLYLRYIDQNVPRPWHKKEKIPFVLTAKFNNNEVVIYKDIYEVQSQQGLSSPNDTEFLNRFGDDGFTKSIKDDYITSLKVEENIYSTDFQTSIGLSSDNENYASPHVRIEEVDGDVVKLTINNTLQFSLRINKEFFGKLLEQDAVEFNFYVSEKHETKSFLNTVGIIAPVDAPVGYYSKPAIEDVNINNIDFDFAKFRLVKTFLINGNSQTIDYEIYAGTATKTNAWVTADDIGSTGTDDYIYAVPNITDGTGFIERNQLPFFDNTFATRGEPYGAGLNNDNMWYSDFTLWDYPADAPPLTLNNSGRYWEGLAANHVETIRGRTFIAGCIDEEGKEEQAIVRYSAVQNGSHLRDVFVEEDQVTFGHSPITALMNYRDQLWVFNRDNQYRIAPHNIYDPSSWEVLDVQHAQGTLSSKTVCVTPNGVCFASKNGIWISDGRIPESLTDNPERGLAIQSLYQRIAFEKTYDYQSQTDPGRPYINVDTNFNPFLELYYSKEENELILSSPVKKPNDEMYEEEINFYNIYDWEYLNHEIRLIYSFSNNNWRTEVFKTEDTGLAAAGSSRYKSYSTRGKFHISNEFENVVKETYGIPSVNPQGSESEYSNAGITFNEPDSDLDYDLVSFLEIENLDETNYANEEKAIPIIGKLITHEIGDGENDFVLRRMYLECSPRSESNFDKEVYGYEDYMYPNMEAKYNEANIGPTSADDESLGYLVGDTWRHQILNKFWICKSNTIGAAVWQEIQEIRDPYFMYELRSRDWQNQLKNFDFNDIINVNMNSKRGRNPFLSLMQTPGNTNYGPSDKVVAHESLVGLYKKNTKFRRARFKIVSEIVVKIRGIVTEYAMFKRRSK